MKTTLNYTVVATILFTILMAGYATIYQQVCVVEQSETYYCQ